MRESLQSLKGKEDEILLKTMGSERIKLLARYLFILLVVFISIALPSSLIRADTKPISELKRRAVRDGVPAENLSASLALVSAYNILKKPLAELDELISSTRKDGKEAKELKRVLKEAREGNYISVCREIREIECLNGVNPDKLSKKELERMAISSPRAETRKQATEALREKIIRTVGVNFRSYYNFRIKHEDKFDQIKKELTFLSTYSVLGDWQTSKVKELVEVVSYTLGRMYLAEFLITLKPSFIREKVECPK